MKTKNIFKSVLAAMAVSFGLGLTACGDNDDFSTMHVLTDAEIAELARQDSILEAQRSQINADLILEYSVDLTISSTSYDGVSLELDWDKIADAFGLTADQVIAGIQEEDGAPEIIGFSIQGSTHADNSGASNTNGYWGHWWDANGDVTTWGSDAVVFCEFYGEEDDYTMSIGQYPGHLEDGQTVKVIECLKYNEVRVAVVITINCHALAEVKAGIVGTQTFTQTQAPTYGYEGFGIEFDLDKVLKDLGISSISEASIISVNADGSYAQENTATNGFWYDLDGYASSWGDDASFYIEYYGTESDAEPEDLYTLYVGQYPGQFTGGESVTMKYGFLANNKIEMFTITVNIEAYQDPETAPEGEVETDREINVTLTKDWDDTYSNVQFDVKEALRQAFKMTTYQIFSAKNDGSLKIYVGELGTDEPSYTSDSPGYWLDKDGAVCSWGDDSQVFCCLGGSETELYLYAGNHPSTCVPGTTVNTVYYITCNGGVVKANITIEVK